MSTRKRHPRKAIVLLIVLGMLSLFSVLVVSFVVFSSTIKENALSNVARRATELTPQNSSELALLSLISGTNDSHSAAFGNSFLEDLYGTDGYVMRVGHSRDVNSTAMPDPAYCRGLLLRPVAPNGRPLSTLFKVPTAIADWHSENAIMLPGQNGVNVTRRNAVNPQPSVALRDLDDSFAGRELTFEEGPLQGRTFRIIRYFGADNTASLADQYLAGSVVIDLSELPSEEIIIDGRPEQIFQVAAAPDPNYTFPGYAGPNLPPPVPPSPGCNGNRLLYNAGPDGRPGNAGQDDDGDGSVDEWDELGFPFTDDYGYRIVINGAKFNGRGQNPAGTTGIIGGGVADNQASIELQFNGRLMGPGMSATPVNGQQLFPEQDEPWDAADWENLFLAWQPSDHRKAVDQTIHTVAANAPLLNDTLGQHIIPSFHRPSVINYLMHAPIILPQFDQRTDANGQTYFEYVNFFDIDPSQPPQQEDFLRLRILLMRLRRATLRPLNFDHFFFSYQDSDLNGDGIRYDGTPNFSGSNPVPILNEPIQTGASLNLEVLHNQIYRLAVWLCNGPWDVDNDGDGIPDSVWTDFNLPTVQAPDGKLIKPMVAALIEDWDGLINVNQAGNFSHLVNMRFRKRNHHRYGGPIPYFETIESLSTHGIGGGVGTTEIDFSHLFDEGRANRFPEYASHIGDPLPWGALDNGGNPTLPDDANNILKYRYANILNMRYGGNFYAPDPFNPSGLAGYGRIRFPGYGRIEDPGFGFHPSLNTPEVTADVLSTIPFPHRQFPFPAPNSAMGRTMDMYGDSVTAKDHRGNAYVVYPQYESDAGYHAGSPGVAPAVNIPHIARQQLINQPYEFSRDDPRADDLPFSVAEGVDFQIGGELSGRLTQLLGDEAERNPALRRLLATDSRSFDVPETTGRQSIVQIFSRQFGLTDNQSPFTVNSQDVQIHLDRMLAVELRKGNKLNLNRALGNGRADVGIDVDDAAETASTLDAGNPNTPNNREAPEAAFPQISPGSRPQYGPQSQVLADYVPLPLLANDFDGFDTDGNGRLDFSEGTDLNGDGLPEKFSDGSELLARHLYCLMFMLIRDPAGGAEFVPNFPYPGRYLEDPNNPGTLLLDTNGHPRPNPDCLGGDVNIKNRYVARRLAQWAANAVDYRDVDASCTRLRYDPDIFDGFDLNIAANHTVWGMERPEIEITETFAMHDKRLRRNLTKEPNPMDPTLTLDGESQDDEDPDGPGMGDDPDSDMDQFRIPQATAIIELRALASEALAVAPNPPNPNAISSYPQPTFPRELYVNGKINLAAAVGGGDTFSPVWRIAVGEATGGIKERSTRWVFDADRVGRDLAQTRPEELGYLDFPAPPNYANEVTVWEEVVRHSAGVRRSARIPDPMDPGEFVVIGDDDLDVNNDRNSPYEIKLERFVWFTPQAPTPTQDVITNPRSGMRLHNVFYRKQPVAPPANENQTPIPIFNNGALLGPGEFAVVAPRVSTRMGQTIAASQANNFQYSPVDQRFEFNFINGGAPFRFDYFVNGNVDPQTPSYFDGAAALAQDVRPVVPLICESLYPHETGNGDPNGWGNYLASFGGPGQVDMGFNISAPLPNQNYYLPPVGYIRGSNSYPWADGYRDYDMSTGFHPDTPLDHETGVPMEDNQDANDIKWNAVGTHQEACTVFLQRLADPTRIWDPVDNPYITVDFSPIDLHTINGEHDVRELIDRDGDGNVGEMVDDRRGPETVTVYDAATQEFLPPLRFDSRRKIPDVENDRVATQLVPVVDNPTPNPADYKRVAMAIRSPMSATFSVLRETGTPAGGGNQEFWPFEVESMWNNGNQTNAMRQINTEYQHNLDLDGANALFRQSLGFINREYGTPAKLDADTVDATPETRSGFLRVGDPYECLLTMPTWLNRDYQSPMEIMNVPATSRTALLNEFSPGTVLQDSSTREVTTRFNHLLGFEEGFARPIAKDYRGNFQNFLREFREPGPLNQDLGELTGDRAGFEAIFNYVDTGVVSFDDAHWIDPTQVKAIKDQNILNPVWDGMFNRTVEVLQPPFNYVRSQRTSGKINLNTMRDYIRRGAANPPSNQLLDQLETPETPAAVPGGDPANIFERRIRYNPYYPLGSTVANFNEFNDGYYGVNPVPLPLQNTPIATGAFLFAGGSTYRSLSWGISNFHELNDIPSSRNDNLDAPWLGQETVMGQKNYYSASVDTRFGRDFKAFIESRRGTADTLRGLSANLSSPRELFNPQLDARYPSRFSGVFSTAEAAAVPSVQRFMRMDDANGRAIRRRTHDMGLMRPHPDFDQRTMTQANRMAVNSPSNGLYSLLVEATPTTPDVEVDVLGNVPEQNAFPLAAYARQPRNEIDQLRMPLVNRSMFERSQAELDVQFRHLYKHRGNFYRNLARDSGFRFQNVARMANVTTNHSNVFMVRMTIGYFVVDPTTGAVGGEYVGDTGKAERRQSTYVVDRSIPVGFVRGRAINALDTVIYSSEDE